MMFEEWMKPVLRDDGTLTGRSETGHTPFLSVFRNKEMMKGLLNNPQACSKEG